MGQRLDVRHLFAEEKVRLAQLSNKRSRLMRSATNRSPIFAGEGARFLREFCKFRCWVFAEFGEKVRAELTIRVLAEGAGLQIWWFFNGSWKPRFFAISANLSPPAHLLIFTGDFGLWGGQMGARNS